MHGCGKLKHHSWLWSLERIKHRKQIPVRLMRVSIRHTVPQLLWCHCQQVGTLGAAPPGVWAEPRHSLGLCQGAKQLMKNNNTIKNIKRVMPKQSFQQTASPEGILHFHYLLSFILLLVALMSREKPDPLLNHNDRWKNTRLPNRKEECLSLGSLWSAQKVVAQWFGLQPVCLFWPPTSDTNKSSSL